MTPRHVWILRDLDNGTSGQDQARYVWAYPTRWQARARGKLHKPIYGVSMTRLGPVEKWPEKDFKRFYGDVGGIAAGTYWKLKKEWTRT